MLNTIAEKIQQAIRAALILLPLAALIRPAAASLPRPALAVRLVASLLPLMLLVQPVAAQQQSFFTGTWDCVPSGIPNKLHCQPDCSADSTAFTPTPTLSCPTGDTAAQCIQKLELPGEPLCCIGYASNEACRNAAAPDPPTNPDPGPDPVVPPTNPAPGPDPVVPPTNPDPTPTPDPVSPPRVPNVRADNAGESTKGGALPLIAGGLFLAHYIIRNATGDDDGAGWLPEGLELDSRGVISHRDGVSGANAGLTARYGDWLARISSRHSGASWARPDASLQWSYRSSSWEFRAYASQSGGAWSRPRAQVEWGWRF